MSCLFGFDVGTKIVGVAVGNRLTGTARALAALPVRDGEPDWQSLDILRRESLPAELVVGLPLDNEGKEQPMTRTRAGSPSASVRATACLWLSPTNA